ncbi:MAG: tetraacyldisaccharide 4'-kinase [Desulfobacterales bacterium]|nr:tetraacyldisaccharide 4'-kinase [Desulfobacterales bacterium]
MKIFLFKKKIEEILKANKNNDFSFLAILLYLLSLVYGLIIKFRLFLFRINILKSNKLNCNVISVGNITAGGTGKTPMTIYISEQITKIGYKCSVISRGYKGKESNKGGVVCDGKNILMTPEMAGDEPVLISEHLKNIPVVIGQNRFESGKLSLNLFKPDVIILDDAFSHIQLNRNINLVLLDASHPFGNNHLLPRGILREPLSSLKRADAVIITRSQYLTDTEKTHLLEKVQKYLSTNVPIFLSKHTPYIYKIIKNAETIFNHRINQNCLTNEIELIKNKEILAFSGIAKNNEFKKSLEYLGFKVKKFKDFPDHYRYNKQDLEDIIKESNDIEAIATTDKDYVKLDKKFNSKKMLIVISVKISFGRYEEKFNNLLKQLLDNTNGFFMV